MSHSLPTNPISGPPVPPVFQFRDLLPLVPITPSSNKAVIIIQTLLELLWTFIIAMLFWQNTWQMRLTNMRDLSAVIEWVDCVITVRLVIVLVISHRAAADYVLGCVCVSVCVCV